VRAEPARDPGQARSSADDVKAGGDDLQEHAVLGQVGASIEGRHIARQDQPSARFDAIPVSGLLRPAPSHQEVAKPLRRHTTDGDPIGFDQRLRAASVGRLSSATRPDDCALTGRHRQRADGRSGSGGGSSARPIKPPPGRTQGRSPKLPPDQQREADAGDGERGRDRAEER
jgi:hypothetical protein